MKEYVATFHTHLSALMTDRNLKGAGVQARMMPVFRKLSSSCGTCVRIETEDPDSLPRTEEMEQLAIEQSDGYHIIWKAENS